MNIESMVIPATNDFASLYIDQKEPVRGFFHYDITENAVFEKRYHDLMARGFDRQKLVTCIADYMKPFPKSGKTEESLKKLQERTSTVVIGGQQAGLLTGPLYTIHKVISIIKLAQQQEELLGTPVIPVFWIAGEDHDFLEINHVYTEMDQSMKKVSFTGVPDDKRMASDIYYDKKLMHEWIDQVFEQIGEREHTKGMLTKLHSSVNDYNTITDLFSYIIMSLFKDYGLLIIDSADPQLRLLEKPFFSQIIDQNEKITHSVLKQQELISSHGFPKAIELESNASNLFYYLDNERILLEFDASNRLFTAKREGLSYTEGELFDLLQQYPERFSNNVVTRPLMQEWLFPTLAFIAGPGEIAYWGELKQAFELFENCMPPIVPRVNITFLDSAVERDAESLNLSLINILKQGTGAEKDVYLDSVTDKQLNNLLESAKEFLVTQYRAIDDRMNELDRGLVPLVEKNLAFHLKQIDFLQNKNELSIQKKHEVMLERYNRIERLLRPDNNPQERIWNIFYFLNDRGEDFIHKLMELDYVFDGTHKLIKI